MTALLPAQPRARPRGRVALGLAVGVAVVLLAWNNVLVPRLPSDPTVRALVNVGGVGALVAAARAAGLTWADLGIGRSTWRTGARWGGTAVIVAAAGYAVALALPVTRSLLAQAPAASVSTAELLLRALLLVPVGTVLCEELAFRGVLHTLGHRAVPRRLAVALGAVVFGAWHLAGALASPSPGASGAAGVLLVLTVTTAGGVLFTLARNRTGSVLAPIGLHLGTNVVGLVAAVVAAR